MKLQKSPVKITYEVAPCSCHSVIVTSGKSNDKSYFEWLR